MERKRYSIDIAAPRETVWHTMLDDGTYRQWTRAFCADTYFDGTWAQGSEIRFLGNDPQTGELAGMFAVVREHRRHELISLQHQGIIENGKPDTTSEAARKWASTFENYAFQEHDGGTRVVVEQDVPDDQLEFFETAWPEALRTIKALAEHA
jgi:uncharacterized protein YndB with AHSA1/START domain